MARIPPEVTTRAPVLIAFGQAVRRFRLSKNFSQEAFAHHCGMDRSYMGGIERGERNVTLVNMQKIVHALGMQPSEFFRELDQTPPTATAQVVDIHPFNQIHSKTSQQDRKV